MRVADTGRGRRTPRDVLVGDRASTRTLEIGHGRKKNLLIHSLLPGRDNEKARKRAGKESERERGDAAALRKVPLVLPSVSSPFHSFG